MKNSRRAVLLLILSTMIIQCSSKSKNSNSSNSNIEDSGQQPSALVEEAVSPTPVRAGKKQIQVPVTSIAAPGSKAAVSALEKPIYIQLNQHIKNQDEESILKEGSAILMKNPNDVKALNAMAMSYYKRGQYALSKSLLLRAMKVEPGSYEIQSNMGIVQLALGDKNEALKCFKRSIELNPNDYVSASNAGSLYVVEQDFEKAVVVLEIAYSKGYRNSKVLSNYAVSLTATGKYEKADKIYREALKDNGNDKGILFNHAILLIQFLKKNEEGLDLVKKLKFLGVPEDAKKKFQDLQTMAERKS